MNSFYTFVWAPEIAYFLLNEVNEVPVLGLESSVSNFDNKYIEYPKFLPNMKSNRH